MNQGEEIYPQKEKLPSARSAGANAGAISNPMFILRGVAVALRALRIVPLAELWRYNPNPGPGGASYHATAHLQGQQEPDVLEAQGDQQVFVGMVWNVNVFISSCQRFQAQTITSRSEKYSRCSSLIVMFTFLIVTPLHPHG